jgi:hypothetical protein
MRLLEVSVVIAGFPSWNGGVPSPKRSILWQTDSDNLEWIRGFARPALR